MRDATSAAPGRRLWFLGVVAGLLAIGLVVVRLQPELERNFKAWLVSALVLLAALLTLLWFLFLSRVRWRTRGLVLLLLAVASFGFSRMLKVDGTVDGRGLPNLAWRWNVQRASLIAPSAPAAGTSAPVPGAVDVPQFFGAERDGVARGAHLARDWQANAAAGTLAAADRRWLVGVCGGRRSRLHAGAARRE